MYAIRSYYERLKGKQFQDEKGNASTSDTDLPFMTRMTPKEKNAWSNSATNGFTIEMEMPRDGRKIPVPAIEHIPLFSTTVNIQKDGRLFVTEEIKIVKSFILSINHESYVVFAPRTLTLLPIRCNLRITSYNVCYTKLLRCAIEILGYG